MGIKVEPYQDPSRDFGLGSAPWDEDRVSVSMEVMGADGRVRGKLPCPTAWEMRGSRHKATMLIRPSKVPFKAMPCSGDVVRVSAPIGSKWGRLAGREFVVLGESECWFTHDDDAVEITLDLSEKVELAPSPTGAWSYCISNVRTHCAWKRPQEAKKAP